MLLLGHQGPCGGVRGANAQRRCFKRSRTHFVLCPGAPGLRKRLPWRSAESRANQLWSHAGSLCAGQCRSKSVLQVDDLRLEAVQHSTGCHRMWVTCCAQVLTTDWRVGTHWAARRLSNQCLTRVKLIHGGMPASAHIFTAAAVSHGRLRVTRGHRRTHGVC